MKPDFVNPEGFSWYIVDSLIELAQSNDKPEMPLNVTVYRIENPDNITVAFVMLDSNNSFLAEELSYVKMACKIDWLRIVKEAKEE